MCQLTQRGQSIDRIVLIDAWARQSPWRWIIRTLTVARTKSKVRRTFASFKHLFHARAIHHREGAVETRYQSLDEMPAETFQRTIMHALKDYELRPLDCRAVLFRARDSHKAHLHAYDPALGWDGLFARGLDIFEMPGDHSTILLRENLPGLASLLQEHLPWLDEKAASNLETAELSIEPRLMLSRSALCSARILQSESCP